DALQRKLSNLDSGQERSSAQKVTQLGASRHLRGEPTLVVRVYDLSDLFSIAPPYAAVIGNDLGLQPRVLFPEAAVPHSGGSTSGAAGRGGMGGMGGGLFDVPPITLLHQQFNGRTAPPQAVSPDVAAAAKTSMQTLTNAITTTIEPDSWEDLSGPGSIARI